MKLNSEKLKTLYESEFTVSVGPVVVEPVADLLVDGRHGLHVALPPLAAQVLGLDLEQFEDVELHHGLLHLQSSLQDGSRLEHHQHLERKGNLSEENVVNYQKHTKDKIPIHGGIKSLKWES